MAAAPIVMGHNVHASFQDHPHALGKLSRPAEGFPFAKGCFPGPQAGQDGLDLLFREALEQRSFL